jgi:hypothetical protein
MDTLRVSDILTIAAVLLSPVIALYVQRQIDRYREKRDRKLNVFRSLMLTRGAKFAPAHIDALNAIEVEFHGGSEQEKKVVRAWRDYCEHLYAFPKKKDAAQVDAWGVRGDDLFVDLLFEMAKALDYDFDKQVIRRNAYMPQLYGDMEQEIHALRRGAVEVLEGKRPLPMRIMGMVAVDDGYRPEAGLAIPGVPAVREVPAPAEPPRVEDEGN